MKEKSVITSRNNDIINHTDCDDCLEDFIFVLQNSDSEFYVGLTTILYCLAIAEKNNAIPDLPQEWWRSVMRRYGTVDEVFQTCDRESAGVPDD